MKSTLNIHWKDWCWGWSSNTLTTWCEEPTHWKRPWCWERWKAGGEGDNRGWDGLVATPTQWTWVWVNSRRWWRTGKPGVLQSMGSQRVRYNWVTQQQGCGEVVGRGRGAEDTFHRPVIRSRSYREPIPPDSELQRCFSVFFSFPLRWVRWWEGHEAECCSSPTWKSRTEVNWEFPFLIRVSLLLLFSH